MIFKGSDGALLYGESHFTAKPLGAMLVVHGLGEHLGRYPHLVRWGLDLGLHVHLMDLRGHGRSQGIRGHASDFSLLASDLENFVEHLEAAGDLKREQPCYLFAHSLGGLIVLDFLAKSGIHGFHTRINGAILSSPALGIRPGVLNSMQATLAEAIPVFLRALQFPSGILPDMLTHDALEIEKYKADPLVHQWITPALFLGMVAAMNRANEFIKEIDLPVLFLLAGRDRVVDTDTAENFATKLGAARPDKIRVRRFHSFYHEVINEKRKDLAFREMKQWILSRLRKKKRAATRKGSSGSSGKRATGKAISL